MDGARVLVVDDDDGVRELLRESLRFLGAEVTAVADGQAALDHLRSAPTDLVLLDRSMPGMDGLEVLRRIRADPTTSLVPVLLVTGRDEVIDRISGLDSGADDYVIKPFDADELAARVRAQLRGQRAWAERLTATLDARRLLLTTAASAAGAVHDLPAAAEQLCRHLHDDPAVRGAMIVAITAERTDLLAIRGEDGHELLRLGAATDALAALRAGLPDGAVEWHAPGAIVALAPISVQEHCVGAVILRGNQGTNASLLALAIDAAGVAAVVLGPAIRRSAAHRATRAHITELTRRGAYRPVFQPVVALADRRVVGHEALTRFDDGVDPERLFREAAEQGVGSQLETATLLAAIDAAGDQPPGTWLALNVTPSFVTSGPVLGDVLRDSGRDDIVLEISELEPVGDYDELLDAVAALGVTVQLSVDDAGSGFASLAHILALEARYVKLDKSWVHGIDTDPAKRALVAGLQRFATETGASLIAEGIETDAQLDVACDLGIEFGQGWLLGSPVDL